MCIAHQAVIAGFRQLVGDSPKIPINSLGIFFFGVKAFASSDALIVLPGNDILGIGPVKGKFIMVKHVLLNCTNFRVYCW